MSPSAYARSAVAAIPKIGYAGYGADAAIGAGDDPDQAGVAAARTIVAYTGH